jgi:hypothetical protein
LAGLSRGGRPVDKKPEGEKTNFMHYQCPKCS